MKRNIPLLLFLCLFFQLNAQSQTVNITGNVFDDGTREAVEMASIRVMNAKDSAYVTGAATNAKGSFKVAVKQGNYIVHVSFLGYIEQFINVNTRQKLSIDDIYLKEDGIMLSEAMVEAKAPEIIIKGDTAEYNAAAYKVQESAVLEDLIKKIPGAEIGSDGKITVNGKDISKILVDGKEFFSDDPKTASKNLPAKMVEKLQVLDKKSDMARLTGFDDGQEETVINLVVNPSMKQGTMGNILLGAGNKERYEGNGFFNIARGDTRVSVLANANNNNNANANTRGMGQGLTKTTEGGVNIASEPSKKLKYDGDAYYSYTDNDVHSASNTQFVSGNRTQSSTSSQINKNDMFRSRFNIEWTPDTLTNIIFRPRVSYNKRDNFSLADSERTNADNNSQNIRSNSNGSSDGRTFSFDGNLLISRKLNNEGRLMTLELSGGANDGDSDGKDYSKTTYLSTGKDSILNQIYDQSDNSYNLRARASYLEPIGRNNFIELAYDIRKSHSETDRKVFDYDGTGYNNVAADYTRNTQNDFLTQNVSLSFQSRRQNFNYTVGAGLEPSSSKTKITQPNLEEKNIPRRNYLNFAPRLEFNYLWDRRHNLRIRYNGSTNQASTTQLYDGIISQNATDTTRGNPNLKPSFEHRLFLRYQKYIPERASSIMAFARLSYVLNDIATITHWTESGGRNYTYENIDGNMNGFFRIMYNTPLRNKKFSINSGTSGNYTRQNTFISEANTDPKKNAANTYRIGEDLRLKFNSDAFQFDLGGSITYENTKNTLSKRNDKAIYDFGGFGNFSWFLPYDFALESSMNFSSNAGYEAGYQQNTWLWDASISKQFLKDKNATVRFKVYDILKERSNISRSIGQDGTATYTSYNTISSYFMVNLILRFQSFKGGAKSSDMENDRGPGGDGRRYGPPPGGGGYGGGRGRF